MCSGVNTRMISAAFFIIMAWLSSPGAAEKQSLCPQEFLNSKDNYLLETSKACYRFLPNYHVAFWGAKGLCKKSGGKLASITSAKDNFLIVRKLQQLGLRRKFWIGLFTSDRYSSDGKKEFVWDDGSKMTFRYWANSKGYATDTLRCVVLDNTGDNKGRWFDTGCWCDQRDCPGFICKYVRKEIKSKPVAMSTIAPPATTEALQEETTKALQATTTDVPPKKTTVALQATTIEVPPKKTTVALQATTTEAPPEETVALQATTTEIPPKETTVALPAPTTTVFTIDSELIIADDECIFDCPYLDCGMDGFQVSDTGCQLCKCN